jgi:hypothetical protein
MVTETFNLLKETSHSFYLALRVLPGAVRPQIGPAEKPALHPSCGALLS